MAKSPSFPFYVKDWLCDPELRLASVLSRGAWIDILCFMWENSQRGKLTATPLKFARLISGTLDESLHFLNEIYEYEFGDIEVQENITFPLTENDCNTKVTVINRRMYSDYKDRQNTRLRVRKYREKKKETGMKQESNTDVTVTSPFPSPFTKEIYGEFNNVKLTKKEFEKLKERFGEKITLEKIENLSIYIASKGKKYKSHYATILSWDRKDKKHEPQQKDLKVTKFGDEDIYAN